MSAANDAATPVDPLPNLLYADTEDSVRDALRAALARTLGDSAAQGAYEGEYERHLADWGAVSAGLGLEGLLIPPELGGSGGDIRHAATALEEFGRSVAPVPFLTSSVISGSLLAALGERDVLATLAAPGQVAALLIRWSERAGGWQPAGDTVEPVAGAIGATTFLAPVASESGLEIRRYTRNDVDVEPLVSLDMTRPLARVRIKGDGHVVARGPQVQGAVDHALRIGQIALASEQVGVAQWCLDTAVDYAKTRFQFGRAIGSFQAVKHKLSDMYIDCLRGRAVARYAADAAYRGDPDVEIAAAVGQAYCSRMASGVAESALQVHGGIGMTWEHPVHLRLKRAKSSELALGTPIQHRSDLGELIGLGDRQPLGAEAGR